MESLICRLFEQHGIALKPHTRDKKKGPCPACGGEDRCNVWPQAKEGRGYYYCHRCAAQGDAIQFMRDYQGLSYADACQRAGSRPRGSHGLPRVDASARPRSIEAASLPEGAEDCGLWRTKATAFAAWAQRALLDRPEELAWLAGRGLDEAAVIRHGLGFNPGQEGKGLIRARASWGLPPDYRPHNPISRFTALRALLESHPAQGKRMTVRRAPAGRQRAVFGRPPRLPPPGKPKRLWLPRGLVIPALQRQADGSSQVFRLRIRRTDEDRTRFAPERKYFVVEGSGMRPALLERKGRERDNGPDVILVLESDLDGLLMHEKAGDLVTVLVLMTSSVRRLPPDVFSRLERADCILVATDFDRPDKQGKRAGAEGWRLWEAAFARSRRWPVPSGKDPGEAFMLGEDLRLWLLAGIPEGLRMLMTPGLSTPAVPEKSAAAESGKAQTRAAEPGPSRALCIPGGPRDLRRMLEAAGLRLLRQETGGYALAGHMDWPEADQERLWQWRQAVDDDLRRLAAGGGRTATSRERVRRG